MRILLTGAGGAAAISVWKSLGHEHEIYMADIDPCAVGLYLVPTEQRLLLPRGHAPEFVAKVLEVSKKHKIDIVIATVDIELAPLAEASAVFLQAGIKVPLSSYQALKLCRDKYALLVACKEVALVPDFVLLTNDTFSQIKSFPLFAKPRVGAGSSGVLLINSIKDLTSLPIDGSYLVQELLPGDEYSVDVYIHSSGKPMAAIPRLRMKIDSGIAVAARTRKLPELETMAIRIAEKIGIRYVANIQFKQARDGQFKLLEINPRFPGTLPLSAAAGIDIPQLLIKDLQGQIFPEKLLPFKEIMMVRYWAEHFCSPTEWEELCKK